MLKNQCGMIYIKHRLVLSVCFCEGKTLSDIEKNWVVLEKAEHNRERALQEALIRLENLEQLAQKFERKVATSNMSTTQASRVFVFPVT